MTGRIANCNDYRQCTLEVYLLPNTPWADVQQLQQRLVFEVGDHPGRRAALLLVEHPPILTVGRQGSHAHVRIDEPELSALGIATHWTNRGGGCWLHGPGMLAVYAIMPLHLATLGLAGYRAAFSAILRETVAEQLRPSGRRVEAESLAVEGRPIAGLGIAVKNGIAYHGGWINVALDPERSAWVDVEPGLPRPMTSLFREMRTPPRPDAVREALVRHFVDAFSFKDHFLANAPPLPQPARRLRHVRV